MKGVEQRPSRRRVLGAGAAGIAAATWVAPTILSLDVAAANSSCDFGYRVINPGSIPSDVTLTTGAGGAVGTTTVNSATMFGLLSTRRAAYNTGNQRDVVANFTGLPPHNSIIVDFTVGIPAGNTWDAGPWTGAFATSDDLRFFVGTTPTWSYNAMNLHNGSNFPLSTASVSIPHTAATLQIGWQARIGAWLSPNDERYGLRDIRLRIC